MKKQIEDSLSKLNFKKKRELRFKNICSNFENEMLAPLICFSKIKTHLFYRIRKMGR